MKPQHSSHRPGMPYPASLRFVLAALRIPRSVSRFSLASLILCAFAVSFLASSAWALPPVPSGKPATHPAWWFERDVIVRINPGNNSPSWPLAYPASDDYAALNQGQLKYIASKAYAELKTQWPAAGWNTPASKAYLLEQRIWSWYQTDHVTPKTGAGIDHFSVVNQGQLKSLAKLFYDVLKEAGYLAGQGRPPAGWVAGDYPWTQTASDDDSYAAANIGQAKYLFSFDLANYSLPFTDSDADGLPDDWEMEHFGNLATNPNGDSDGDSLTNLQEYQQGSDPDDYYSQGSNTITPVVSIISGNNQEGLAGLYAPEKLTVKVTNGIAGSILPNAPVVFSVQEGGDLLSSIPSLLATRSSQKTLRTDSVTGEVSNEVNALYYLFSGNLGTTGHVSAGAGNSIPVLFTFTSTGSASLPPILNVPSTLNLVAGQPYTYTLQATNNPQNYSSTVLPSDLALNPSTGVLSGTVTQTGTYPVVFSATNTNGTGQAVASLVVTSGPPRITSPLSISVGKGQLFEYVLNASYNPQTLAASGLPAGLSYDAGSARVSGVFTQEGTYTFSIQASNNQGSDTKTVTVTVGTALSQIQSASQADATRNQAFSFQILATNSPLSYAATTLPSGLAINTTTGLISGTPTVLGSTLVKIGVTNASGTTEEYLRIRVNPLGAPVLDLPEKIYVTKNQSFSYQIVSTGNPTQYQATGLPAGLSINTTTGLISGTPTTVGTPEADITVTNAAASTQGKLLFVVLSSNRNVQTTLSFQQGVSPWAGYQSGSAGLALNSAQPSWEEAYLAATQIGAPSGTPIWRAMLGYDLRELPADAQISSSGLTIHGTPRGSVAPVLDLLSVDAPVEWDEVTWNNSVSLATTALTSVTPSGSAAAHVNFSSNAALVNKTSAVFASADKELRLLLKATSAESIASNLRPRSFDFSDPSVSTAAQRPKLEVGYSTGAPPEMHLPEEWVIKQGQAAQLPVYPIHAAGSFSATGLPAGLSIHATTGTLSGTPASVGTFTAGITAANANGTGHRNLKIRVISPVPAVTSPSTWTFVSGQQAQYIITATNNPTRFTASSIPYGLTLHEATGVLSGTVANPGNFTMTVRAENEAGTGQANVAVTVQPTIPQITSNLSVQGNRLVAFSYYIDASQNPTSFSASNLPPGLSFLGTRIQGIPTQEGEFTVQLSAANAAGTGTAELHLTIGPPPIPVVHAFSQTAVAGEEFYGSLWIENGSTQVEVSSLPPGLSLSGSSISGTPIQTGTFTFDITATNAYGTSTGQGTIIIRPAGPWISGNTQWEGVEEKPLIQYLYGQDGATQMTLAGLPPGLSFTANGSSGTIQGTPMQAGVFVLTATFSNGSISNQVPIQLTIQPVPVITSALQVEAQAGQPFSYALTATGGATSLSASPLPQGWSFNSASGILTGTPQRADVISISIAATNVHGARSRTLKIVVRPPASDLVAEFQAGTLPTSAYKALVANIRQDSAHLSSLGESLQEDGIHWVGRLSSTELRRLLLGYDLSALPDDIEITSASLVLHALPETASGTPARVEVHRAASPFLSETPDWANNSSYASELLSSRDLDAASCQGTVDFYASPAFAAAVQQAIEEKSGLDLVLVAPGAEAGMAESLFGFVKTSAQPEYNPKLRVTYKLLPSEEAPKIQEPLLAEGVAGQNFEYAIQASHRPSSYTASGLPSGLSLNTATGVISGTPSAVGEYRVALQASNAIGTGQTELVLRIRQNATVNQLEIVSGNQQTGLVGTSLPVPLKVRVLQNGTPVSAALVVFTAPVGQELLVDATATPAEMRNSRGIVTDAQGMTSVVLKLPQSPGLVQIQAAVHGVPEAQFLETAVVQMPGDIGGDGQVQLKLVAGGGQSGPAGQTLAMPVTIQALNALGTPLEGKVVQATLVSGAGSISPGTAATDAQGRANFTVTPQGLTGAASSFGVTETVSGASLTFSATVGGSSGSGNANPGGARSTGLDNSADPMSIESFYASAHYIGYNQNYGYNEYEATQADLQWYKAGNPTSFRIERKIEGQDWQLVTTLGGGASTYSDNNLKAGRRYQYRIYALRNGEKSAPASAWYRVPIVKSMDYRYRSASGIKRSWSNNWSAEKPTIYRTARHRYEKGSYTETFTPNPNPEAGYLEWEYDNTAQSGVDYGSYQNTTYSNAVSTGQLIQNVEASLTDYSEWYDNYYGWNGYGWGYYGWDYYYGYGYYNYGYGWYGWWMSNMNLSDSETYYSLWISDYRLQFYPSFDSNVKWLEIFIPEEAFPLPPQEAAELYQVHATRSVKPSSGQSPVYTIDPRDRDEDGQYYVVPVTDLVVSHNYGVPLDEKEKEKGVPVGNDFSLGASLTFSPSGVPGSIYKINWTHSSSFKVYAYRSGQNEPEEISNGWEFTEQELYEGNYYNFVLVAKENAPLGLESKLTLKVTHNGETLNESSAKFIYPDDRDYSMPIDEASGAQYRKIALNGLPLSDSKPQASEESDAEPEETYIDALTLGLRHSTTDVFLQVPGSDLSLSARRDYLPESWSERSGLRPQEQPDKPFGVSWSSNLTPSVKIVSTLDNPKPSEPAKAYVTDESGATHSFVITYDNFATGAGMKFFPMPTAKNQQAPNLASLELDNGTSPATLVFKRKFGTTIRYEMTPINQVFPDDRLAGSKIKQKNAYARAKTVTDRLGNILDYSYESQVNLVPKTISVRNHPDMKLSIRQDSAGLITSLWDAKGNETSFVYDSYDYSAKANVGNLRRLKEVHTADGAVTKYDYDIAPEADLTPVPLESPQDPHWHCELKTITDPLNKTYQFAYLEDHSKMNYKNDVDGTYPGHVGYYTQSGLPRNINTVTMPNGTSATFQNNSKVWIAYNKTTGKAEAEGQRKTIVTDATQFVRSYTFDQSDVVPVPQVRNSYPDTKSFVEPKLVVYQRMSIQHGNMGSESFEFDLNAAMALKKTTDFSGNTTTFTHADAWSGSKATAFKGFLDPAAAAYGYYSDPTSQTNALGGTKTFTYEGEKRLMKSVTDELGRYTEYDFDPQGLGRRIRERIYTSSAKTTLVKETEFQYGNSQFPGFMTKQIVHQVPGTSDSSWTKDLVTESKADNNGRLAEQIVDPAGLHLSTKYTYDKNGNKLTVTDPRGNSTWFSYDSRNRLITVTYADGSQKQMVYNTRGNKVKEYDENGNASLFAYDNLNRLSDQARDMDGSGSINAGDLVTHFTYNAVSSKLSQTDPKGNVTTFTYDSLQRLTATRTPAVPSAAQGYLNTFEYGANSGGSAFDSSGFKPTRTTDPRGYVSEVTYDALYRPIQTKAQLNLSPASYAISSTEYDAVGNARASVDPLGKRSETDYDSLNRPTVVRFAVTTPGQVNSTYGSGQNFYTSTGFKWKSQDQLGRISETEYDAAGRPVKATAPEVFDASTQSLSHPITTSLYDAAGNVAATINPLGKRWDFVYDVRNRKISELQPAVFDQISGQVKRPTISSVYDNTGKVIQSTDARGNSAYSLYDKASRATHSISPAAILTLANNTTAALSTVMRMEYDANGNVLKTYRGGIALAATLLNASNPSGVSLTETVTTVDNTYDALNRLTSSKDTANITVNNEYDAVGNRTAVIDGKSQRTEFTYDGLNRNLFIKDPANKSSNFFYDALNKTDRLDSQGVRTHYAYDQRHRLDTVTYFSGASTATNGTSVNTAANATRGYAYDKVGNLLAVTEPGKGTKADVAYTYDALNRQITETSGGLQHQYKYDLAGNRLQTVYGGTNRTIASTYDVLNRLSTMTEGSNVTSYAYDLNGGVAKLTQPNGETTEKSFDSLSRVLVITTKTPSAALFSTFTQTYDLAGNVLQIVEVYPTQSNVNRTTANTYDAINRLASENVVTSFGGQGTTTYSYDNAHNRSQKIKTGTGAGTINYTYNNLNQLVSTSDGSTYAYDANGNRLTQSKAGQTDTYTYDYENRLVGLGKNITGTGLQTGTFAYVYDYRSRRVERDESNASGVATKLIFSGGTSVQEYTTGSSTPTVELIRGSDYGGGVGGVLYTLRSGTASFNHYNTRGDVVAKTSSSGAMKWGAQYSGFGKRDMEISFGFTNLDRQKANTKDEDPTGLLNEGFRYRDLETGTFITRDPLGFVDGPNMYAYVVQNPWTKFDPEGLEWKTAKDATLKNARDDAFSYAGGVLNGSVNASQKISNAVMHPGETAKSALIGTLGALVNASVAAQAITSGQFGALGQAATNAGKESIASVKDTVSDPGKLGNAVGETAINTLAAAATAEIGGAVVGAFKAEAGIVYKRTNPKTGEEYVGQAKSPERFDARQGEHDNDLGVQHDYEVLGKAPSGTKLDVLEEDKIRTNGGLQKEGGTLANKRHQMSEERYRANGGKENDPNK